MKINQKIFEKLNLDDEHLIYCSKPISEFQLPYELICKRRKRVRG